MACANSVAPLSLSWTNVSVHASSNVPVRGVEFRVGTPAQTLSLWPSFGDNNTWVPNSLDCDNSLSNLSCIATDGGIYITSNSSSYSFAAQSSWNGSNTLTGIHTTINDKVSVGSNATIWGMPLVQHIVDFDYRNALGLGADSSFLKSLVSQKLAPSTDFGIWSGSQSVNNPIDGSLIVGGYDESKVGSLTNFSSIPGCLACAVVSSLELTLRNGSTTSLLNATVPSLNIAIDPYFSQNEVPVMQVPDIIRDILVAATDSFWLTDQQVYGWMSGRQPGNLKVGFNNGYQVTIPGSELWLPPRGINSAGQPVIQNASEIMNVLRASGAYTQTTTYVWGQPFLSTNYMIVWPSEGVWGLSPISATQKTSSTSVKSFCSGSGAPASADKSSKSNVGAIAGGVVGGVLGLLLIVLAALFFIRRRNKKRGLRDNHQLGSELQNTDVGYRPKAVSGGYGYDKVDSKTPSYEAQHGGSPGIVELAGGQNTQQAPSEMFDGSTHIQELQGDHVYR